MNDFFCFISSTAGRVLRIVVGAGLVAAGAWGVGGTGGWVMAAVGLLPLGAGLFDLCIFAPLAQLPFGGNQIRAALHCK